MSADSVLRSRAPLNSSRYDRFAILGGGCAVVKLSDVNTTDIRAAIRLGCRTMASVFNADDHDLPYFGSQVRPHAYLSGGGIAEAHVPGRHLNALLNAEDAAGIDIDEAAVEKHARAAFFSYSGPLALPLGRTATGGRLGAFDPHNVREGFHALCALAQFRDSARAQELAAASIAAIFTTWDPDSGWDRDRIERDHGLEFQPTETFIVGLARAIGPLVKYFRATGYGPALELAIVLTEKATSEFFLADGSYDARRFGAHTHSTTCVMSSLAQLADLTSDAVLMERVKAFYDHGLWRIRDALGWVMENSGDKNLHAPDRGEANNTGDILETALILGRWGYPEAYHDAERILRGHLLPSQLRDTAFIVDPPNPTRADGLRDLAARHRGAFGFPAPYGHEPLGIERVSFNMDIVGGAVGSLCEAYRDASRFDQAGHWVNLLVDHETEAISVESIYTHRTLTITIKRPAPLFVRLPPWVPAGGVTVEGMSGTIRVTRGYLFAPQPPLRKPIRVSYALPRRSLVLAPHPRDIRVRLRGDAVTAMDNFDADLTFFDPID